MTKSIFKETDIAYAKSLSALNEIRQNFQNSVIKYFSYLADDSKSILHSLNSNDKYRDICSMQVVAPSRPSKDTTWTNFWSNLKFTCSARFPNYKNFKKGSFSICTDCSFDYENSKEMRIRILFENHNSSPDDIIDEKFFDYLVANGYSSSLKKLDTDRFEVISYNFESDFEDSFKTQLHRTIELFYAFYLEYYLTAVQKSGDKVENDNQGAA